MDTVGKTFSATDTNDSYPTHKTVSLIEERVIADKKVAKQEINAVSNYPLHKTITIVAEQDIIKTETIPTVNKPVTSYEDSYNAGNYPTHKTVVIPKEEITVTTNKSDTKTDSSYPAHKTVDIEQPTVMQHTERIPASVNTEPVTDSKSNTPPIVAPAVKAKKPVLWIAISSVLLLSSGATAWYAYQQKKNFQEEIITLKKENETLAETVKKMEKQLHLDDIIARAGKLDTANNIAVMENANSSEVIRLCFSVTANPQAKNRSKQVIYIRFIDANNNILSHRKENLFDYKGESIPFSIKRVIDAVDDEMMICADYKPSEQLQKGTYKAEIYNEGVLDGTTTFELK